MSEGAIKTSIQLTACKNVSIRNNIFNTAWKPVVKIEKMEVK